MWASIKTVLAGLVSAAFTGATTAAMQQGSTGDWDGKTVGTAASAGAIAGAIGYLLKGPRGKE